MGLEPKSLIGAAAADGARELVKQGAGTNYLYNKELIEGYGMIGKRPSDFELVILLVVEHLYGNGYGVSIANEAEQLTDRSVSLGAVYATLDRLERKGLVSSKLGEATPERGGKPKRYYSLEALGQRALADAKAAAAKLWSLPIGESA